MTTLTHEIVLETLDCGLVSERDQHDATKRSVSALKGENTKLRRVHKGVCPHCNRTFANVARHMASQHPEVIK